MQLYCLELLVCACRRWRCFSLRSYNNDSNNRVISVGNWSIFEYFVGTMCEFFSGVENFLNFYVFIWLASNFSRLKFASNHYVWLSWLLFPKCAAMGCSLSLFQFNIGQLTIHLPNYCSEQCWSSLIMECDDNASRRQILSIGFSSAPGTKKKKSSKQFRQNCHKFQYQKRIPMKCLS